MAGGKFYREAVGEVLTTFPDVDPGFEPATYRRLIELYQRVLASEQEAYDLRQSLGRAEMANLALGQALGVVEAHDLDCAAWTGGTRVSRLIRSAMRELSLAQIGAPNPEELDTGPAATMLAQARGHLEIAQPIAGPARKSVEVATELIDAVMDDLARLGADIQQMRREAGE